MSKGELTSTALATAYRVLFPIKPSFFSLQSASSSCAAAAGKNWLRLAAKAAPVFLLCTLVCVFVCGKFNLKWKVWLPLSLPIPPCVRVQLLFNQHKVYCACVCGCVFEMNACFFCGKGGVAFVAALLNECERWFISTNFMCKFNTLLIMWNWFDGCHKCTAKLLSPCKNLCKKNKQASRATWSAAAAVGNAIGQFNGF